MRLKLLTVGVNRAESASAWARMPPEEMVGERGKAELALGVVEQVDVAPVVPQRDMRVAAIAGQMHERLRHKGGAQSVLPRKLFDHEFEEHVAIGGDQRVVIGPVHLELAVGVLVIALIGRPAELKHRIANRADQLISAQECGLVIAGLRLPVGLVGDREAIRPQYKKFGLDPGLHPIPARCGRGDLAL